MQGCDVKVCTASSQACLRSERVAMVAVCGPCVFSGHLRLRQRCQATSIPRFCRHFCIRSGRFMLFQHLSTHIQGSDTSAAPSKSCFLGSDKRTESATNNLRKGVAFLRPKQLQEMCRILQIENDRSTVYRSAGAFI